MQELRESETRPVGQIEGWQQVIDWQKTYHDCRTKDDKLIGWIVGYLAGEADAEPEPPKDKGFLKWPF